MKIRKNLVGGLAFLLIGVVALILIPRQIGEGFSASQFSLGPRGLPYLTAIVMIAVSLVVILRSTILGVDQTIEISIPDEVRAVGFYAIVWGVILLTRPFGFLVGGVLLVNAVLAYTRIRKVNYYIYATVFAVLLYFAFVYGLNVRLPSGTLFGG